MKRAKTQSALARVDRALAKAQRSRPRKRSPYFIPSLWTGAKGPPRKVNIDPFTFYRGVIGKIRRIARVRKKSGKGGGGEWTRDAVIYNMFVRTTAAFDHNGNGRLDLHPGPEGFRETGTFLKALAMLPYIQKLGANTVHLLPVTSIGHDGNKGTLGSPYAIRNPYELDEQLAEPALGLDARTEFAAFVEAAHRLGLRVVAEFVFRTAAKDADWIREHPEWFYWIREEIPLREQGGHDEGRYGSPVFHPDELERIHRAVNEQRFDALTPPHPVYREMFTQPPAPEAVHKADGRWLGALSDGTSAKIPGAFADWPPDDNQPPWGDVTYLRMYHHPDFNYIAYNTIRMYDTRLAAPEHVNRPLWNRIVGIIPYYQREFHIDGVMIDMGHALPMELKAEMVRTARSVDPDFAFWDENFSVTPRSREEGYNAVFGFCWIDQHHPDRMRNLCSRFHEDPFAIPFFATPENHNTPRASARPGGRVYARWAWVVNNFVPAIPFIHSGFELTEEFPINTGLDFTVDQLRRLPSETLPLFSAYAYDWVNRQEFTAWITRVARIRAKYKPLIVDTDPSSFTMLEDPNPRILAFARRGSKPARTLAVVGSMNYTGQEQMSVALDTGKHDVKDLLGGKSHRLTDGRLNVVLEPGECLVFEF
jgi:starch synthase (maltosyl-transferring)